MVFTHQVTYSCCYNHSSPKHSFSTRVRENYIFDIEISILEYEYDQYETITIPKTQILTVPVEHLL